MLASTRANAPLSAANALRRPTRRQPLLGPCQGGQRAAGPVRHRRARRWPARRGHRRGRAGRGRRGRRRVRDRVREQRRRAPVHRPGAGEPRRRGRGAARRWPATRSSIAARRRAPWPRARRRGRRRPWSAPRRRWCARSRDAVQPARVPRSGPSRRRAWRVATGASGNGTAPSLPRPVAGPVPPLRRVAVPEAGPRAGRLG